MTLQRARKPALVALLLAATVTAGQATPLVQKMLGAAASKQETAAAQQDLSIADRRAEVDKALVAARQAVELEKSGKYPIPAGATPSEVAELGWLLGRIPQALQAQLDLLQEIDAARAARATTADALAAWKGFSEPGPYSLTQLDRLLDQLDAENTRLHSFQSVSELQREELQRVEAQLKASQAAGRLALEKATDGVAAPLELAKLRTRRTTELLQLLRLQGELNAELTATAQARVALLQRQVAVMSADYRFAAPELERVLNGLQSQISSYDKRIEEVQDARAHALEERDQVRRMLAGLPAATTVDESVRAARGGQGRSGAMGWILLEALVALLLAIGIVWWTMGPKRKRRPPDGAGGGDHRDDGSAR